MPLYMVLMLSQFIVSLLTLVVGEKEKKIKEGLRMMGLKDSVYWCQSFHIMTKNGPIGKLINLILISDRLGCRGT